VEQAVAERTSDLRSGVAALRRRWYAVAAAAILGLCLGVFYSTLVPVQLGSKALVLLSGGGSGDSADSGVLTQVRLVTSTPVLARAGKSLTPNLSATQVSERIKVEAATSQLIEIEALSPRARESEVLAQAVADAYVATLVDTARSVTGAVVRDLKTRQDELVREIKLLQGEIIATNKRLAREPAESAAYVSDAQLRGRLLTEQTDVGVQLDKVKSELAASGAVPGGSTLASVVQPAAPATGPGRLPALIGWAATGALLAAAAAASLVVVRTRRDPRLRARDDMADAVGSSVLADVRSRPQRSVAEWSALFETYVASPVDAWAFRQLLRALATSADEVSPGRTGTARGPGRVEHPRSLTVLTLAGDRRGLSIAPQLAAFVASLGLTTRFVIATADDTAASLRAACSGERAGELRPGLLLDARSESGVPVHLVPRPAGGESFDDLLTAAKANDGSGDEAREEAGDASRPEPAPMLPTEPKHSAPDLTIVLAVLKAGEPALDAVPSTAVTMLAIAPRVGSREDLARLAVAVDDAGRRVDGVVVVDPDPSDRTTGRRTLDERARQAPLPLRITGVSQPMPRREPGVGR
jgi:hypothetical protein